MRDMKTVRQQTHRREAKKLSFVHFSARLAIYQMKKLKCNMDISLSVAKLSTCASVGLTEFLHSNQTKPLQLVQATKLSS